jgi:hypothetical protein
MAKRYSAGHRWAGCCWATVRINRRVFSSMVWGGLADQIWRAVEHTDGSFQKRPNPLPQSVRGSRRRVHAQAVEAPVSASPVMLPTFRAQHERNIALERRSAIPLSEYHSIMGLRPIGCDTSALERPHRQLVVNVFRERTVRYERSRSSKYETQIRGSAETHEKAA